MAGKMMNAGQICLAPDYVFVPKENVGEFVESTQRSVKKMYPDVCSRTTTTRPSSISATSIASTTTSKTRNRTARAWWKSTRPMKTSAQQPHHKIPPTLILDANDSMKVMQDEIFGPLMPVQTYDDLSTRRSTT